MKHIKQITVLTALALLLINLQNIRSQTVLSNQQEEITLVEIPQKLKSLEKITQNNRASFLTHSEYSKKLKGTVTIISDSDGKIVKITAPQSVDSKVLVNERSGPDIPCPHCLGDNGYDSTCVVACVLTAIFGSNK